MKAEKDFIEFGKEKLEQAKALFEELEVQVSLGKAEAMEVFETEKKKLSNFIHDQQVKMRHEAKESQRVLDEFEQKLDALAERLVNHNAGDATVFEQEKATALQQIFELEADLKAVYHKTGAVLRPYLDNFRNALDAYRVEFALITVENLEKILPKKEELRAELSALLNKIQESEKNDERLDHFKAEMETAFEHMKKAVKELIKS
jgi:polyhydroxyalkanoate synthesis regulator phasin